MNEKLKPCAHCGGEGVELFHNYYYGMGPSDGQKLFGDAHWTCIQCRLCHSQSGAYLKPIEAIAAWNRRANDQT